MITNYQLCNQASFSVFSQTSFRVMLPTPLFPAQTSPPLTSPSYPQQQLALLSCGDSFWGGRAAGRWALLLWEASDHSFLLAPQPPSPPARTPQPPLTCQHPKQTNGPQPLSCLANSSVTFQGDRETGKIRPLVRPEEPDGMYAQRNSRCQD